MTQLFANAARAELAATINATDTTISVVDLGALFPVANTDTAAINDSLDWFKLTIQDKDNYEIVFVRTHASGSNEFSNVLRGQEGTVARSFLAGSIVGLRPTAGDAASVLASLGDKADKAAQELGSGVDLNTIQTPGIYVQRANDGAGSGTNYPVALAGALVVLKNAGVTQLYCPYGPYSGMFIRSYYGPGGWYPWREVYHSGNINTANAGTATKLQTARSINGKIFDGTANIETSEWYHSKRDFVNGTLISTDINYSVSNGDVWVLEIRGNSYNARVPFDIQYQGHIYNNTIISHGGYSNGTNISDMVALNVGGRLCFWFPRQDYWQGFNVRVYSAGGAGRAANRLVSITDEAKPDGTKEVALSASIRQSLHSGNFNSYSPTLTGEGASGTWDVSITGNAATATTLQTARTLTIGNTGKSVDGSADVSWSLAEIGAQPVDADLTAIAALTGTSGLLKKTATDIWSLDTTAYLTDAPRDGKTYGRRDAAWTEVIADMSSYTYNNRGDLRASDGKFAVVDGLGLFQHFVGSDEPDDDESCFATATGRWLLQAAHWDLVDAWQLPEVEERDAYDEDEPLRFASSFASKVLSGTATCAITSVASVSSASFTGAVTGASVGDRVIATPPAELGASAKETGCLSYHAWVSAANTVTVMLTNGSAAAANTNAAIRAAWPITVIKS